MCEHAKTLKSSRHFNELGILIYNLSFYTTSWDNPVLGHDLNAVRLII